jgi:MFS family permease
MDVFASQCCYIYYSWPLSLGYSDALCACCGAGGITTQKSIILVALFIYIGGYQVGFGPVCWLIISEIFPLEVRGKAVSLAVVTNFLWNTIMTFIFPAELEYIGTAPTFYLYALILVFGIYFIYTRVPETKGLSLEEIEDFFVRKSGEKLNETSDGDTLGQSS